MPIKWTTPYGKDIARAMKNRVKASRVIDTDLDAVPTIFDWDDLRLAAYTAKDGFVSLALIDPVTTLEIYGVRASSLTRAEISLRRIMYLKGFSENFTLGRTEECPSCQDVWSVIHDGSLIGYGFCDYCHTWEDGHLFPGMFYPLRCPWPKITEISGGKSGDGQFVILVETRNSAMTGRGETPEEAESRAFDAYLEWVSHGFA